MINDNKYNVIRWTDEDPLMGEGFSQEIDNTE
jgi:hypothetical protein